MSEGSSPSENKPRRYIKTGKYSKKKYVKTQEQIQKHIQKALQQRQQPLTPQQILTLQHSLQAAAMQHDTKAAIGGGVEGTSTTAATDALQKDQPPIEHIINVLNMSNKKRSQQVEQQHETARKRYRQALSNDQFKATRPDFATPFRSREDMLNRLLPFHIYQYPIADLDANKIPMERQDHAMLDIYKAQQDIFSKYAKLLDGSLQLAKDEALIAMLGQHLNRDLQLVANMEKTKVNEQKQRINQELNAKAEWERIRKQHQQQQHLQRPQKKQHQAPTPTPSQFQFVSMPGVPDFTQPHFQPPVPSLSTQTESPAQSSFFSSTQPVLPPQIIPSANLSTAGPSSSVDDMYRQTIQALMQNQDFASEYNKLTPDQQKQFLQSLNHETISRFLTPQFLPQQ
ncbi:hypothetical protein DM01DRAFT_1337866 [Hesseltinella vesiculosa]|uniref:GLTSCR protein conserved domain-containing protein n=1 Tax=Hesseltinella vesiculosa TaxID=101127 RepID=A0A1X2GBX2_9FUNG|nr:hypothetical protein DM01DRAFT_1337866 [Hesseltinella vesiculosa]